MVGFPSPREGYLCVPCIGFLELFVSLGPSAGYDIWKLMSPHPYLITSSHEAVSSMICIFSMYVGSHAPPRAVLVLCRYYDNDEFHIGVPQSDHGVSLHFYCCAGGDG